MSNTVLKANSSSSISLSFPFTTFYQSFIFADSLSSCNVIPIHYRNIYKKNAIIIGGNFDYLKIYKFCMFRNHKITYNILRKMINDINNYNYMVDRVI